MQEHFLYIFPVTFPALALAHFVALLSPGPDFFLILGNAARHRLRGSVLICLGIALGNAVYIALAVLGWSGIKDSAILYRTMELAGAAYLFWMASKLWKAARMPLRLTRGEATGVNADNQPALPPAAQLLAGLGSALLNPKNAMFYLTLMTVIIGAKATLPQQFAAGAWMTILVFFWDLLVAGMVSHPAVQTRLETRIPLVERGAALTLGGLAAGLAVNVACGLIL